MKDQILDEFLAEVEAMNTYEWRNQLKKLDKEDVKSFFRLFFEGKSEAFEFLNSMDEDKKDLLIERFGKKFFRKIWKKDGELDDNRGR